MAFRRSDLYAADVTSSSCAGRPQTEETTLLPQVWTQVFQIKRSQGKKDRMKENNYFFFLH